MLLEWYLQKIPEIQRWNISESLESKKFPILILASFFLLLKENCPLVNKSISESKTRERSKGLVVRIERNGKRILNPESDLVFDINDKVWIVGNELRM